ncbi:MAG: twin transmembrane helix small protein [Metallibacterium sp.]
MHTLFKTVLILMLLAAIFSLGQALFFMMTDREGSNGKRTAWALTRRIGFSLGVFVLVIIGILTGLLKPHGLGG